MAIVATMGFRDDDEALRNRVDALEDELARTKSEAERLRGALEAKARETAPAAHGYTRGMRVWIEWRGTWWRGSILDPLSDGQYRVHYTGWSSSWDEIVTLSRLAPADRPAPGRLGPSPAFGVVVAALIGIAAIAGLAIALSPGPHSGPPADAVAIASASETFPGEPVWVEWNGVWYEGIVVLASATSGLVRIHYQGYSSDYDEDVTLVRLRVRP